MPCLPRGVGQVQVDLLDDLDALALALEAALKHVHGVLEQRVGDLHVEVWPVQHSRLEGDAVLLQEVKVDGGQLCVGVGCRAGRGRKHVDKPAHAGGLTVPALPAPNERRGNPNASSKAFPSALSAPHEHVGLRWRARSASISLAPLFPSRSPLSRARTAERPPVCRVLRPGRRLPPRRRPVPPMDWCPPLSPPEEAAYMLIVCGFPLENSRFRILAGKQNIKISKYADLTLEKLRA